MNVRPLALAALVVLSAAAPAAAAVDPAAQKVLDRYVEATGGREALLRDRTVHVWATISAFGFAGRIESWAERPDKRASVTVLGPFTLKDGDDGVTAWRIDQNGKFAKRDGKDLDDARASSWFENENWLLEGTGGGRIAHAGTEKDSAGSYDVLEVAPPTGRPRRLWFDRATGFHVRTVQKDDTRTIVTAMSDWRTIAGRKRAMASTLKIEGMPLNDARVTVDSMRVGEPVAASRFAPPDAPAARDVRFLGGDQVARLPFEYSSRHLWVNASIDGGPPEAFLLDTGASITVLDSAWAARKGLKVEGRLQAAGAGATGQASFSAVDSIVVAGPDGDGVAIAHQKVGVLSINPFLEPFFWRPVAGVLGYDFISRFVVEIDFDAGTLVLHDPARFQYAGKGTAVPLTLAGNIPVVKATLDDRYEGEFRLDIGSGSTVDVHGPFVEKHDLGAQMKGNLEVVGGGFGGTFTSRLGRMKKMAIGPYSWSAPLVSLSGATSGGLASEDYAGNIGNQLMERFHITFDYERRVVYLEPAKRYPSRDRFSMSGLLIARMADGHRAMQVLPGSPAALAGVRNGDEVVSVDRKPIAEWTQDALGRLFEESEAGRKVAVEVRRDGKKKKLTLTLAELL